MRLIGAFIAALALMASACAPERGTGRGAEARSLLPQNRLTLPTFDLETYRALLDELRGRPVVVNFWGSWCPPCAAEAPGLAEVSSEFEGEVQFVGVDILDARPPARAFIVRSDWQYPSVFDPTGSIRDGLGYVGQPITLVYDSGGSLAFEWIGAVAEDQLRREIRRVL
jgi:thiol-disulfide isomerase/thioredoxin